jgi:hypothetical protein
MQQDLPWMSLALHPGYAWYVAKVILERVSAMAAGQRKVSRRIVRIALGAEDILTGSRWKR